MWACLCLKVSFISTAASQAVTKTSHLYNWSNKTSKGSQTTLKKMEGDGTWTCGSLRLCMPGGSVYISAGQLSLFATDLHISASPRLTREIQELPPQSSTDNKHPLDTRAVCRFCLTWWELQWEGLTRTSHLQFLWVQNVSITSARLDILHLVQCKSTFSLILDIPYVQIFSSTSFCFWRTQLVFVEGLSRQNTNTNSYLQKLALPRVRESWKHFFILLHSELGANRKNIRTCFTTSLQKVSVVRHILPSRSACLHRNDTALLWRSDPWHCTSEAYCPLRRCQPKTTWEFLLVLLRLKWQTVWWASSHLFINLYGFGVLLQLSCVGRHFQKALVRWAEHKQTRISSVDT